MEFVQDVQYAEESVREIEDQLDKEFKSGKDIDQIEKDIADRIAEIKPIQVKYDAGKEIVKIIEKAEKLKSKLEVDKSKINKNYRKDIIEKKERELELSFIGELSSLMLDLEEVKEKEVKYKQDTIKNNKLEKEYQTRKKEVFDILLKLGDKLEADLVIELLRPLIIAKDLSSIRILSKTASKENKLAYTRAIEKVEEFTNTDNTSMMIDETLKYFKSNLTDKSLQLMQMMYNATK